MKYRFSAPNQKQHNENKPFLNQKKIVFKEFFKKPSTMLEVSFRTGILRANICRYVAEWRKTQTIAVNKKALCSITKTKAKYLTTNPELFPKSNQIKLF